MKKLAWLPVVLATTVALAGENGKAEWPNHRGAGSAGVSPDTSVKPPLELLWSYRCDSDTSGDACAGPTVGGGMIFTPMAMGRCILALEAHTGRYLWEYPHRDLDTHTAQTYSDGKLFVWTKAYGRSTLVVLNAKTGKPVWQKKLKSSKGVSAGRFGPAVGGGKVLLAVGGGDPQIVAFNIQDGSEAWRRKLGTADGAEVAAPVVVKKMVLTGVISPFVRRQGRTGAAIALSLKDGKELWRNRKVTVSRPLVSDGEIAVAKYNGQPAMKKGDQKMYVLDARTGKVFWTKPHWVLYSDVTITPEKVIQKYYGGTMIAYDRKDGRKLWTWNSPTGSGCCSPSVSGKYAYVGNSSFNDSEGIWAWRFTTPPHQGKKGDAGVCWTFHAVDLDTGKSAWHVVTGNNACGDPAIAYGRVYFNSRDGRIYCFAPVKKGEKAKADALDKSPNASPAAVKKLLAEKLPAATPGADWPMEGGTPLRVGMPGAKLGKTLAKTWELDTGGRILASPVAGGGKVYVGSLSGKVFCADLASGAKKWEFQTGGEIKAAAAVAGGVVYCGSDDGRMYALDASSGAKKWEYQCGGPVQCSPAVVGGVLFFGANDHHFYALEGKTGKKLWSFKGTHPFFIAPPVVKGDTVYCAQWVDWAYALDATSGKLKWKTCVPISIEKLHFYRDKFWLRSAYQAAEFDPASGKRLRIASVQYGYNGLTFLGDTMFTTGAGAASAYDLSAEGKTKFHGSTHPVLKGLRVLPGKGLLGYPRLASMGTPLVAGGMLVFVSTRGEITLADPNTAQTHKRSYLYKTAWKGALPGKCHSSAILAGGTVVVGCDDGKLYAFRGR